MLNIGIQFFGGRGGGGSGGARGGGRAGGGGGAPGNRQSPSEAPVGTKWTMGGYTYTKNKSGTWTTYKNGKRYPNRTNADIKRVFA